MSTWSAAAAKARSLFAAKVAAEEKFFGMPVVNEEGRMGESSPRLASPASMKDVGGAAEDGKAEHVVAFDDEPKLPPILEFSGHDPTPCGKGFCCVS